MDNPFDNPTQVIAPSSSVPPSLAIMLHGAFGPLHATQSLTMNKNRTTDHGILLRTILEIGLMGFLLLVGLMWCIGLL
jgi:hypothetical protein